VGDQHIARPIHTQNKSLTYVEHEAKCRFFFLVLTFGVSRPICSRVPWLGCAIGADTVTCWPSLYSCSLLVESADGSGTAVPC